MITAVKIIFVCILFPAFIFPAYGKEECLNCHTANNKFSAFHNPAEIGCTSCHAGNALEKEKEKAHQNLEAFPGSMATVEKSCGQSGCHQELIPLVRNSVMNTVDGMVSITREVFGEKQKNQNHASLQESLAENGADSYLRKLCVSCHLSNNRKNHQQSLKDRGGGCAACHLQTFQDKEHPTLSVRVQNDRCFGCHSRSGRISLNYVGLAETDTVDLAHQQNFGRLADGRLVKKLPIDVHSRAGMACIDCHTVRGVMGTGKRHEQQLDIQCSDCHAKELNRKPLAELEPREALYSALYPDNFHTAVDGSIVVSEKNRTPLVHLWEKTGDRFLKGKVSGKKIKIPVMKSGQQHELKGHERLSCDSCHASWAPQCYGCHIEYDSTQKQWDHLKKKRTPGRWIETRWAVHSGVPALGVTADNQVTTFVPGMNLILQKTPESQPIRRQLYASLSPHTTQGRSRTCESCHQNAAALGIISEQAYSPEHPEWSVPMGWIQENAAKPGKASKSGERSFNQTEIRKIRRVGGCLQCHTQHDPVYDDFKKSLQKLPADHTDYK
ncbi:MAG: hypothetical protein H8E38_02655 [SAR324 cluster bacterium]|nr:hypothetical protein [SAR324 cluster bacterium]